MLLLKPAENCVIERFHGGGHKAASRFAQGGQALRVLQQVFHFDGYVVSDLRVLYVQSRDDPHGVADAVEEIRITKGDVLGSHRHLAANVFKHYLRLDDAKDSVVNRDDGTVPAAMLAAPAGFRIACDPSF